MTGQRTTGLQEESNYVMYHTFCLFSGVFKFMFWRFGKWEQVLVDDLIPTKDGSPVFTFSKDDNEWWGALLEKAYAKYE